MFLLKLTKRTYELCRVSCINTARRNIVCYDRARTNNYIISNSGIAENNTICSDKNIVSYFHNAYFGMRPCLHRTCIVCKDSHIACQCDIVTNRN